MASFTMNDIPDLTGKDIIVTGGTAGLGLVSVVAFAKHGAHVITTARNEKRAQEGTTAIYTALAESSGISLDEARFKFKVDVKIANQEDLKSVNAFADWFLAQNLKLHVLLCNAGIAFPPFKLIDGIESTFYVNHVSHHLLVKRLLPVIRASAPSRIVFVSSLAHTIPTSVVYDPQPTTDNYYDAHSYGWSKAANIMDANYFQRLVGSDAVFINSLHPGSVSTSIATRERDAAKASWLSWMIATLVTYFGSTPEKGALTQM
ncbi:NAD(P)-binding protein [Rhizoclosmatium globosum]|uniref:NAD(P)-binding protein n=1 Tax=Rhizoclosmatium globosum TaxID=329046 RepID=A0A1Y2BK82_9FUNG|nr:NAD(P)-binding protein [Rhizoclosmatium globosum]|eukprot:ORY35183.1 NAD(P)-binding protein [Rhizoclosmatium globosum]